MSVFQRLTDELKKKRGLFFLLLDPDRKAAAELAKQAKIAERAGADAVLVGSSMLVNSQFDEAVAAIKQKVTIPLILFPGNSNQIAPKADAVLFLSLLSGRNPDFLIGEQVKGAPLVKKYGLEPISTGYLLIESGKTTSVEYVSDTRPIPRDKPDIACSHALAAEYFGMKLVYLEAGSGSATSVPDEVVSAVSTFVSLPVIAGGGIRTPEEAARKVRAGAKIVVAGNQFEKEDSGRFLAEFAAACHKG
jgi:phosphoglycerol geranylgeranyltransferase